MELRIFEYFGIITIFQLVFFAFFLLMLNKGNKLSNRILAFFLLAKALCYSSGLVLRFGPTFFKISPHFFFIGDNFEFLLGPALYFYAQSLAFKDFKFKKAHLVHLLPFAILLIGLTPFYILDEGQKRMLLIRMRTENLFSERILILYGIAYTHFVIYVAFTLSLILKYRSKIKAYYSSIEKINLSWLFFLGLAFMVLWIFAMSGLILRYFGNHQTVTDIIFVIAFFTLVNFIVYKGLRQPEVFAGIESYTADRKQTLSKSTTELYLNQLKKFMAEKKPYLIPSLTLNDLAEKTEIPPRSLSHIINNSLNQSFFDFINSYRVLEAQHLLSSSASNPKTILEILYEVGFNSKSVFNTAFKKQTHMTPSDYKKKHQYNVLSA